MHEHNQSRYFDKLDQFLAIINNRVNRMTKLPPVSVSQKDVNYLVSLCHTNAQKSQNSKLATNFALGARLTHFIEVTRYNSQKNCLQLRQYQQTTPQLISSRTATGNLYKENFTNLNSCYSVQTDLVNNGQTIRNCWAFKLQSRLYHESHFKCFHGDFSRKHIVQFTTLLPTPIHLSGEWQVALLEIAWPNSVQNVTVGEFAVHKRNIQPPVEKRPRKHNRPGAISMAIPAAFDRQSPSTLPFYAAPVKHRSKPGC